MNRAVDQQRITSVENFIGNSAEGLESQTTGF